MFEKDGSWVHQVDVVFSCGILSVVVGGCGGCSLEGKEREVICG